MGFRLRIQRLSFSADVLSRFRFIISESQNMFNWLMHHLLNQYQRTHTTQPICFSPGSLKKSLLQ